MRIEVQSGARRRTLPRISAPGLGVWRGSDPGVEDLQVNVRQVTNLSSPAITGALVRSTG